MRRYTRSELILSIILALLFLFASWLFKNSHVDYAQHLNRINYIIKVQNNIALLTENILLVESGEKKNFDSLAHIESVLFELSSHNDNNPELRKVTQVIQEILSVSEQIKATFSVYKNSRLYLTKGIEKIASLLSDAQYQSLLKQIHDLEHDIILFDNASAIIKNQDADNLKQQILLLKQNINNLPENISNTINQVLNHATILIRYSQQLYLLNNNLLDNQAIEQSQKLVYQYNQEFEQKVQQAAQVRKGFYLTIIALILSVIWVWHKQQTTLHQLNKQAKELQRISRLFSDTHDGIIITDDKGSIIDVNPAFCNITGYHHNDILGQNPSLLSSGKHGPEFYSEMWSEIHENGVWQGELSNRKKDGEIYTELLTISAIMNEDGEQINYIGIFTDISERKKLEDEIFSSAQRLKLYRDQAPMTTIEWNTDFQVLNWNSAAEKMFGYTVDEVKGRDFVDIMLPDSAIVNVKQIWADLMAQTGGEVSINENLTKDGRVILCEWRNIAIKDDTGKVIGAASIVQDVTERETQQQQLKQSHDLLEKRVEERTIELAAAVEEANKASKTKSEFLANMSHELRTPMHGILSFAKFGMTKSETATREKLQQYFSTIQLSGQRLLTLLNDLLDLSKLEAGKMELSMKEADLTAVFKSCQVEQSQRIKELGLTIILNNPSSLMTGQFDPIRIGQVITNLLSNAIKFSPEGGKVTVNIDLNDQQELTFLIRDEGPGIPENELEAIFDVFVQSSKIKTGTSGTGLGLAISKEIIAAHHGKIWVENCPENGAIFKFVIPATPDM